MRRLALLPLVLAATALICCVTPASAVTIYGTAYVGTTTPASLYTIDPSTGVATLIGATGYTRVGAIDFDPLTGVLYGIGTDATGNVDLITINTTTGAGTTVGNTGIPSTATFPDISFRSDGTLFGLGNNGSLYTINLTTGVASFIGSAGLFGGGDAGNATAFNLSDVLYNIHGSTISTLDTTTGTATATGTTVNYPVDLGTNPRANAMDYDTTTGILYASVVHGIEGPSANFIAEIDLSTGTVTGPRATILGLDGLAVLPSQANGVPDAMSTLWLALPLCGLFAVARLLPDNQ